MTIEATAIHIHQGVLGPADGFFLVARPRCLLR